MSDKLTITRVIEFDCGHRIYNHKGKCQNPHGHRYRLEATFTGPVNSDIKSSEYGMIGDFGNLKELLMATIHEKFDHGFLVFQDDEELRQAFSINSKWKIITTYYNTTVENMTKWCFDEISKQLSGQKSKIYLVKLKLFETPNSWAEYSL